MGVNLVFATPWNGDVADAPPTPLFNALYYGISRVSWLLATFLVFLAVFLKNFTMASSQLTNPGYRMLSKSLPIFAIIQILVIQLLCSGGSAPDGITMTIPIAIMFGLGFIVVTCAIGVILLVFVEFPFRRLLQLTVLPYVTHDYMLQKHYVE